MFAVDFRASNTMLLQKSFEHLLFDKHDDKSDANEHVDANDNPKSPQFALEGNACVHAPKRRYHGRGVHQKREHGERLHDDVEVV